MTIANANILVVGGSSGIGFGVARAALDAGARSLVLTLGGRLPMI